MASSSGFFPIDVSESTSSSESSSSSDDNLLAKFDFGPDLLLAHMEHEEMNLNALLTSIPASSQQQPRKRRSTNRPREQSHEQLWNDYFAPNCTYRPDIFRRRFRMRRELFLRITSAVEQHNPYFLQKPDCSGRLGLSPIQKVTTALRILAYGFAADHCDEYLKIGQSTAIESLKAFCTTIISLYEAEYMRAPTARDVA